MRSGRSGQPVPRTGFFGSIDGHEDQCEQPDHRHHSELEPSAEIICRRRLGRGLHDGSFYGGGLFLRTLSGGTMLKS